MKTGLLIVFATLLLSSCTKVFMYSYGLRNPKVESERTLNAYLKKKDLGESTLVFKDTAALMKFFLSGIGMPEARFYDKNGYLMLYRDEKKCNAQNDSLISFLDPVNVINVDSSQNIREYIKQLRKANGTEIHPGEVQGQDFYLIMYWAKYLGKMNSDKVGEWEKTLASLNKNVKVTPLKVSVDYMNFWELDKKSMIKIYGNKLNKR
jgi:hypothetical protein